MVEIKRHANSVPTVQRQRVQTLLIFLKPTPQFLEGAEAKRSGKGIPYSGKFSLGFTFVTESPKRKFNHENVDSTLLL